MSWGIFYKMKPDKGKTQGEFFRYLMDTEQFLNIVNLAQSNIIKHQKKKSLQKHDEIALETKIYIPIHEPDQLTTDTVYESKLPEQLREDLDLPFSVEK